MMTITLTSEQLKELISQITKELKEEVNTETATTKTRRYVYGLRGIANLFHVSLPTAQKYKNTFLAPAVTQRGRKIAIDVEKAIECYNQK